MDARGIRMSRNLTQIGILMIFCCVLYGCASTVPQRKEVLKEQKIHEQDLPDDTVRRPGEDEQIPAISGPPAPAAESPTNVEHGSRSPRRFIWRDRKGSEKAWDTDPQGGRD
jgi:hypothetical protein